MYRLPDTPLDGRLPYPAPPHVLIPAQAVLRDHIAGLHRTATTSILMRASRTAARVRRAAADTSPGPAGERFISLRLARVRAALVDYNIDATEDRRGVIALTRPDTRARLELHPTQAQIRLCVGGGPLPGQPARPIATLPALPIPPASTARPAVLPDAYDQQVMAARAKADAEHARECARLQARIDAEAYAATPADLAAAGL